MFIATEVERKRREVNLLIDMQINLFLCKTSDYYFSDLGQIATEKPVGTQIGTNFQNYQITGRDSICSKQLKLKEKEEK